MARTMNSLVARPGLRYLLVALVATATVAYAYQPLLSSWYVADDWHFFALYRHLDSPFRFVTENPVTSYFYRPIPLLLGWGAFQLFELNTAAQYLLSVALHVWVAFEIYRLALVQANDDIRPPRGELRLALFALALLFVLLPLNAGTVAWISNRFDLIATAASIAALRSAFVYARSPHASTLAKMTCWAMVACLSKESGFAAIAACALLVCVAGRFDWRARRVQAPIGCLVLVVVAVFVLRFVSLGYFFPPSSDLPQPVGQLEGVLRWSSALVRSLQADLASTVALGALLVGAAVAAAGLRNLSRNRIGLMLGVAAYAVVVIVAQAPIAKAAFPDNATVSVSNRFFYSIIASMFIVAATVISCGLTRISNNRPRQVVTLLSLLLLVGVLSHATREFTTNWSRDTQVRREATIALLNELKREASRPTLGDVRCALELSDRVNALVNVDGFLDFTLKAHLVRGDAATNCLVVGNPPIATSFTRLEPCAKASFAPYRSVDDRFPAIGVGGVCKYFFLRK